jgi:hypothetical protein
MQERPPTLVVANKMLTASTLPLFRHVSGAETVVLVISVTQNYLPDQTQRPTFLPSTINSADLGFPRFTF